MIDAYISEELGNMKSAQEKAVGKKKKASRLVEETTGEKNRLLLLKSLKSDLQLPSRLYHMYI